MDFAARARPRSVFIRRNPWLVSGNRLSRVGTLIFSGMIFVSPCIYRRLIALRAKSNYITQGRLARVSGAGRVRRKVPGCQRL
jgi:hypothetical protein